MKKQKNAFWLTAAAVLTIILLTALLPRLFRLITNRENGLFTLPASSSEETPEPVPSTRHRRETSSAAVSSPDETTEPVSYPAESLPDYEVHTLPPAEAESTAAEPETAPSPETTVSETVPGSTESTEAQETAETAETTAEPLPSKTSAEFTENSDNLPFIGTWTLEYDLAPTQEAALAARYTLPRTPEVPVVLRLSVVLADDGSLRLIYAQEDADAFKNALANWYSEAASIYTETGANSIQKAAFLSWAAYRKGIYSLLSPETVKGLDADWHAEGSTVFITDNGEVQAEIFAVFEDSGLTVDTFRVVNDDFRDTVSVMQETLGFSAPFYLTKN